MWETSGRLLRLLSMLQDRRDWTGPELAGRLGVTTRTVRNDMDRLRTLGYPVDATPGAAGGYRLGIGAALPPLLLDDDEAVAVAIGLRVAAGGAVAGIADSSVRALAKLDRLLPVRLRRRIGSLAAAVVALPAHGTPVDATVLTTIAGACRDHERLRFGYRRHDGTDGERSADPHRLVHADRRWYLVAWDVDRQDWRTFRVDRMTVRATGPVFTPRPLSDADVRERVGRGLATVTWRYRARVTIEAPAERIRARLPSGVEVTPDGPDRCVADLGSDDPRALAFHLGMLDADFQLETDAVELRDELNKLAARYTRAARLNPDASRG